MNCFDITKARAVYAEGGNVTEFLRRETGSDANTSDIIEIAYDLQAGSYIKAVRANMDAARAYVDEIAGLIAPHLPRGASLLDVGTGELTTFSLLAAHPAINPSTALAFDISWSRLDHGVRFWSETAGGSDARLVPFVADLRDIPLATNSIDVVTSSHALEPNGGALDRILSELFRICRHRLVLFEPSYELNSPEGQARMERLGYIRDIEGAARRLGGTLQDVVAIRNISNPLNPTACYVISPPDAQGIHDAVDAPFAVPGTDFRLREQDGFYVSTDTGLAFPILKDIPVLKPDAGILASSLTSD